MTERLIANDGELLLCRAYYPQTQADKLFKTLLNDLDWQPEDIIIFGKSVRVPRLMCWHGEPEAIYRYSGVSHIPLPYTDTLLAIQHRLKQEWRMQFNSVLGNLYRTGADSMGWHADNEPELGLNPTIASLNFGERRLFRLRHNKNRETVDVELAHGDLLIMRGALQHHWRHCLPKTRRPKQTRINLTFRQILPR